MYLIKNGINTIHFFISVQIQLSMFKNNVAMILFKIAISCAPACMNCMKTNGGLT